MRGVALLALLSAALLTGCSAGRQGGGSLATVYDSPSDGGATVRPQVDGPLYDLPPSMRQHVVHDRSNRAYVVIESAAGGIAVTPLLDEDGQQEVTPRP